MSLIQLSQYLNEISLAWGAIGVLCLSVVYLVGTAIYNIYFHPLRNYPGPKLFAATFIPSLWLFCHGRLIFKIKELHEEYGDVVRIAPDELAFIGQTAQKDIYSYGANKGPLPKCRNFYFQFQGADSIVTTPSNSEHARIRKMLAPGFSERAMREQEATIVAYINLFIQRLYERHHLGPQDLSKWFNLITFDVIGDLAFGEPFGSVNSGDYHPWVHTIMNNNIWRTLLGSAQRLGPIKYLFGIFVPKELVQGQKDSVAYTKDKVARRISLGTERADFMSPLLAQTEKGNGFSTEELEYNAMTLVVAGSETTATLLTGLTYHLLMNPSVLDKLTAEIRSAFSSPDEINLISVQSLKYELAVLDEGLRMFPPASAGLPRRSPPGGCHIAGHFVPEGSRVHVSPWAAYQSPSRFYLPESFIPERWMGDKRFAGDDRSIVTPFSIGPRNCIAMNLAYSEMRIIVAKLLWNFDLTLSPQSYNWLQTARKYQQWYRDPLMVSLKPREDISAGENVSILSS